jgi:lipopolysaccharide transport system ATP-binding protein
LNQQRIFSTGTHLDTHFSKKFYQGEILYCKIQKINLIQGSYRVMIAIGINSPRLNKEVIYDGLFFEVINDNYFNNGLSLSQSQGNVVFKPNWELL